MRRKVRSLSDLYRRIPKCASSSVSADPQSPSINISAAQAGTVSVVARIYHDWVGVKSTACLAYALHEHLNVQDKKNEGKNRRGAATIASAGAAIGIGNVLSSSIHSVARNPSLAKQLFGYAILGFALTEAIASFAPMMAFLISFVFQWEEDRWERAEREQSKFQWWAVFAVPFHRLFLGKSRSNRSQGEPLSHPFYLSLEVGRVAYLTELSIAKLSPGSTNRPSWCLCY
ncbi:hypothetical protein KY285_026626 [Solanum tuberosum]|nr:hypothetical protein KY285_026626 [Solanum tuberosum]